MRSLPPPFTLRTELPGKSYGVRVGEGWSEGGGEELGARDGYGHGDAAEGWRRAGAGAPPKDPLLPGRGQPRWATLAFPKYPQIPYRWLNKPLKTL